MSRRKYATYELKLITLTEEGENILTFLKSYLPSSYPTIAEANAKRRAIAALFGEAIEAKVVSVRRVPARTVRRVLRL